MTLHVVYSSGTGTTTDLVASDRIRLASPMDGGEQGVTLTANAEEGAVAISTLFVDDEDGSLNLVGHRRAWIWESAEDPGNQMIWTGSLGDRSVSRGEGDFVTDDARRWAAGLVEANAILSRRIITGADGNRPAETDVARVTWLVASSYLATVDNGLGYLDTSGPVAMEAADLRGQTAFDVLNDCANRSGKNFHLVYRGDTSPPSYVGTYSIWYGSPESATYSSTLRLTNVDADVDDSTTFAVNPDVTLRRDPSRVYSGVYLPYEGGTLYQQDTATRNAFAARDTAAPNANVKSSTKAAALASRYLADAATEDDRIDARFMVPKEKVNHLREGQRVEMKFSHLPGYSSAYGWARVLRRTVTQLGDENYEIAVELAPDPSWEAFGSCSYTANATPSTPSSLDVLGAYLTGPGAYVAASPVYPSNATFSQGGAGTGALYGTPNNGSGWGITSGVSTAAGTITARWTWDLLAAGSPRLCAVRILEYTDWNNTWVEASDDGVTWSTILTIAQLAAADDGKIAVSPADSNHRYWALAYSRTTLSGLQYYEGLDMTAVMLWGGSL